MAIAVGSFAKTTSTTPPDRVDTISNPLSGTAPKSVILFVSSTSAGTTDGNGLVGVGFYDGTNERSAFIIAQDGEPATNGSNYLSTGNGVVIFGPGGSMIGAADITFSGNDVVVTWTTSGAAAYIIHYVVTDQRCEVGNFASPGTAGAQSISTTNVGKALMVIGSGATAEDTFNSGSHMSLGFGVSASKRGSSAVTSDDGAGTTSTWRRVSATAIIQHLVDTTGAISEEADFDGFTSGPNGFDLDWGTNTAGRDYYYIMFYDGDWDMGIGDTKTTNGTQAYTTTFKPEAVLFGVATLTALETGQGHSKFGFGATDGTANSCVALAERTGQGTTQTKRLSYTTDCIVGPSPVHATTELYRARHDSFNATDFTLDFQVANVTARKFLWLAYKEEAASGTALPHMMQAG